jgi:hypothetical protein
MHNRHQFEVLAEWLLARFTGKLRAKAVLGDLEEAAAAKGNAWYWRCYANVLVAVSWRITGSYLAVVLAGPLLLSAVSSLYHHAALVHAPTMLERCWGSTLSALAGFTGVGALFSAVRFGLRDPLAGLMLGLTVFGATASASYWSPPVLVFVVAAACLFVAVFALSSRGRRTLFSCACQITLMLVAAFVNLVSVLFLLKMMNLAYPKPFVLWLFPFMYLTTSVFAFGMSAWIHRALMTRRMEGQVRS